MPERPKAQAVFPCLSVMEKAAVKEKRSYPTGFFVGPDLLRAYNALLPPERLQESPEPGLL